MGGNNRQKPRLDTLLHERGMFESRAKAQAAVMAGEVLVDGRMIDKPGMRLDPETSLEYKPKGPRYVSRGGEKLEGALKDLGVNVSGKVVLDVGASTGGFTDCLCKHGASKVYALDVGYGIIDQKLRESDRVVVLERTNIRYVKPEMFDEKPDMAVVDVSFISLRLVFPVLSELGIKEALTLVKPQFEAGKAAVDRGKGVIRSKKIREEVLNRIIRIAESYGYVIKGQKESRLHGPKGNIEVFIYVSM